MKSYSAMTEGMLWRELRENGSSEAERELLERYAFLVKRSLNLTVNGGDPEDYHHASYFGLAKAVKTFDPSVGASFETYALRVMHNMIIDEMRRSSSIPQDLSIDEVIHCQDGTLQSYADTIPGGVDPHQLIEEEAQSELLDSLMVALNEEEKIVLKCNIIDGISLAEISGIIERTKARARYCKATALGKIRRTIFSSGNEQEEFIGVVPELPPKSFVILFYIWKTKMELKMASNLRQVIDNLKMDKVSAVYNIEILDKLGLLKTEGQDVYQPGRDEWVILGKSRRNCVWDNEVFARIAQSANLVIGGRYRLPNLCHITNGLFNS